MSAVRCERCSGEARLTSHVAPLGRKPGYRIYCCEKCSRFAKIRWPGFFQQQQQSQPPPKKGE